MRSSGWQYRVRDLVRALLVRQSGSLQQQVVPVTRQGSAGMGTEHASTRAHAPQEAEQVRWAKRGLVIAQILHRKLTRTASQLEGTKEQNPTLISRSATSSTSVRELILHAHTRHVRRDA